ncbi:hypothetical protein MBRA1_001224 [Malassezia brasiliensis]|uniref:RanBD1 domain-containing protein n=1 Tax=Malassezia brasiliensis TaxID=1821822 RepID=A0AAF0IP73_9BASI|nr:hypothetical protein MBRA1_001224 [Malassezia brasiliensis]
MQERPDEDGGGMRRSSSRLGGLFSWISPFRQTHSQDAERGEAGAVHLPSADDELDAAHTPSRLPSTTSFRALPTPPAAHIPRTESMSALRPVNGDVPVRHEDRARLTAASPADSFAALDAPSRDALGAHWTSSRSVYQADSSIASNPSPLAQRPAQPASPFHPGSLETPTRRAPPRSSSMASVSPFAPSTGRRHRPIYFGGGVSPHPGQSPMRSSLNASRSMNALPPTDEPKRRKTEASPSAAFRVQYAPPSMPLPASPANAPTRKRAAPESVERADDALRTIRAAMGEPPLAAEPAAEAPSPRTTRAASTMRSVLETSAPRNYTPPVPEVVNPYQTRSRASPSPTPSPTRAQTPKSTRARALEAARQRASTNAAASKAQDTDAPPKVSLLDMVERTAPASVAPSPRRSRRLHAAEDEQPRGSVGESELLEAPKAAWQHRPKKPSPLAMTAEKESARSNAPDTGAAQTDARTEASVPPQPLPRKDETKPAPAAPAVSTAPAAPAAQPTPPAKSFSFGPSTSPAAPAPTKAPAPPAVAPAAASSPAPAMPAALPEKFRDVPDWAILTPPGKRMQDHSSEAALQAAAVSYERLPTFAFQVTPARAVDVGSSDKGTSAAKPTGSFGQSSDASKPPATTGFSFGKPQENQPASSGPSLSKPADDKTAAPAPIFSFGKPAEKPGAPAPSFSFGKPAEGKPAEDKPTPVPSFSFGKPAGDKPAASAPSFSFGKPTEEKPATTTPSFSFGKPAGDKPAGSAPAFSFGKPVEGKPAAPAPGFSFGKPAETPASTPGFSFGKPASESVPASSGFSFSKPSDGAPSGFSFGSTAAPAPAAASPSTVAAPDTTSALAESADAAVDKSENTLTATGQGEEDEDTEHEVRAKIWKLEDGKWKDLGVTVFRIKKNKETGKCRVLARNAVNGNVVLNFLLYTGMKVTCEKSVLSFVGMIDAKPSSLRCKVKTNEAAVSLKDALISHSA